MKSKFKSKVIEILIAKIVCVKETDGLKIVTGYIGDKPSSVFRVKSFVSVKIIILGQVLEKEKELL